MPHNENLKTRIPLPEDEALRLILKVKPTADMPRPGANPTTTKKQRAKVAPKKGARKSAR
jgi:hypothetical protein